MVTLYNDNFIAVNFNNLTGQYVIEFVNGEDVIYDAMNNILYTPKPKIFTEDDGEYVEFEEVTENKSLFSKILNIYHKYFTFYAPHA